MAVIEDCPLVFRSLDKPWLPICVYNYDGECLTREECPARLDAPKDMGHGCDLDDSQVWVHNLLIVGYGDEIWKAMIAKYVEEKNAALPEP